MQHRPKASSWAWSTLGNRFRLVANEIEVVPPRRTSPEAPGGGGRVEAGPQPVDLSGVLAECGWTPSHALSTALDIEALIDYAVIIGVELVRIDVLTTTETFQRVSPLEPGVLPPGTWPRPRVTGSSGANLACRGSRWEALAWRHLCKS